MSISIKCGKCETRFRAGDEHAGKQTQCPKCGNKLTIPSAENAANQPRTWPCADCDERFPAEQLINDRGDIFCQSCFNRPAARMPMTKVLGLIAAACIGLSVVGLVTNSVVNRGNATVPPEEIVKADDAGAEPDVQPPPPGTPDQAPRPELADAAEDPTLPDRAPEAPEPPPADGPSNETTAPV